MILRRKTPLLIALLAVAILASVPSAGAQFGDEGLREGLGGLRSFGSAGAPAVQVITRLVADVQVIEAGKPFRLGVIFEPIEHWHIYWRYPGEVGLPTLIEWTLPEGFEIGDLQLPNPTRFYDPESDLTSYGWESEVLLFAWVTPPEDLGGRKEFKFAAANEWLACEIQCVPGDSTDALTLGAGEAGPSKDAEKFEAYAARVPKSFANSGAPLSVSFRPEAARIAPREKLAQVVSVSATGPWKIVTKGGEGGAAAAPELFPDGADYVDGLPTGLAQATDENIYNEFTVAERVTFDWVLDASKRAPPGAATLKPAMTIPMVNERSGETRTFYLTIERDIEVVEGAPEATLAAAAPQSDTDDPKEESGDEGAAAPGGFAFEIRTEDATQSIPLFLFFAFVGGLILNIMPCVLPVLSIKVLGFVNQAHEDPKRVFYLGLVFASGVFASFAALATVIVVLKSAGNELLWGFQLQEPRFVILMSAVIFAFGLSLFGVFSIDLPGSTASNLQGAATREGPAGAFFNGLLATALATPCTAPLLGPALGVAFSQSGPMIYVFFAAIASGLALPYVLLSARPGWLKFVPKPGPWMVTFKQAMGVLLMATVVWLLSVVGGQVGSDGIVQALSFLLAVGVASWILGRGFDLSAPPSRRIRASATAAAIVVATYLYFPERYLSTLGEAYAEGAEVQTTNFTPTDGKIDWQPFSVERVNELVADNKTVFVDFTADWCLTCKVNERTVLSTRSIREAFAEHGVVALVADYTRRQPEFTKIIRQFGRAGVPVYVIFPAGRPEDYILLPEILTVSMVKEKLAEAAGATEIALSKP